MKTGFVTELLSEQTITSFFLVHEKEVRNTREGRSYLRLELGDRSGTIEARMWEQFEIIAKDINRDDFVKVQARVEVYRNKPQLALVQVRLAKPEEIDLADYLPHTAADVEKMWVELLAHAESIRNPWLRKLILEIVTDPGTAKCYKRAPAAKVMHHAYLGGLLEHVIGLCGMSKVVAGHYPELDVDLLLTAALLHDVGKLEELCYERAIGYTTPGQLLGHIVMELETVTRTMDKIDGFPAPLKTVIQHLLISHHGQYEFGSPKLPMIREAMVFHYLDDLDSKLAAVRVALASGAGDEEWSAYSSALGRKFLKLDAFLKTAEAALRPEQLPLQPASEPK
jgi:3'-5' exoribonuclease